MARTMIHENNIPKYLWAEAINTTCYVQDKIYIRHILNKTSYELFKGRKPIISYFNQFGCTCYILNNKAYMNKFDVKAQKGIFLGYSKRSKAYRVYNFETNMVEESIHTNFDEKDPDSKMSQVVHNFSNICVSKDTSIARGQESGSSEEINPSEVECSEVIRTPEANNSKVDPN